MPVSVLETSTDTPIAARLNELGHRNWRGESLSPKKVIVVRNAYKYAAASNGYASAATSPAQSQACPLFRAIRVFRVKLLD